MKSNKTERIDNLPIKANRTNCNIDNLNRIFQSLSKTLQQEEAFFRRNLPWRSHICSLRDNCRAIIRIQTFARHHFYRYFLKVFELSKKLELECVSNKTKWKWKNYEHHQTKYQRHPSRVINEGVSWIWN